MSQQLIPSRNVILHFHLFKNAGTSLDALLKENFPAQWLTKEFESNKALNHLQLVDWIKQFPETVCFSSHTAKLPPPEIDGVNIFPLIFMRHPIDRIASVYLFEKKQGGDGKWPTIARNTSFKGYLEERLIRSADRQCINFHVERFASMFPNNIGSEFERAKLAVETLPFVGIVEDYEGSIQRMTEWLKPHFPNFKANVHRLNTTRDSELSLENKLEQIQKDVGEEMYGLLEQRNQADLDLYFRGLGATKLNVSE